MAFRPWIEVLRENLRLRLAQLGTTWQELAPRGGESPGYLRDTIRLGQFKIELGSNESNEPGFLRGAIRAGQLKIELLDRIAKLLNVPSHELLDPGFNPKMWDPPEFATKDPADEPSHSHE